jgi:alpha-1,2-mannosyltransferase
LRQNWVAGTFGMGKLPAQARDLRNLRRLIKGSSGGEPQCARIVEVLAWSLWVVLLVAISVMTVRQPMRSIFDAYRDGVHHWWAGEPLYSHSPRAFVYLTASPLVFTPFVLLGQPLDDLAWRVCSVALFLYGLWRLVGLALPAHARLAMAVILLLMLPCAGVNVQRGQAEIAMAALMFLGAADVAMQKWWRATLWLCLGFALKPLAFVLILLFGALLPPLRWRLVAGVVAVLLLPFLHPDPHYVVAQDRAMVDELLFAAQPGVTRFNDIAMMLNRFAIDPPPPVILALRIAAAAAVLWLAAVAVRRWPLEQSAIGVLALSVAYLVVFNPRTELGSYMNLAALVGISAAVAWYRGERTTAVLLALLILGFGTQVYGNWLYRLTDVWLKPLLGLAYLGWLARRILARPAPA